MKNAAIIAVLCCLPRLLVGSDGDLRTELTASYTHKGLFLRHPVRENSQRYDASGKLVSRGEEGSWTAYAPLEVTTIELSSDNLRITGNRLIYAYYPKIRAFLARRQKHPAKIKIEIALGTPVNTLGEANAIISRVFAANPAEIVASLPDYWRVYFQKRRVTAAARESSFSSAAGTKTSNSGPGEKGPGLARIGVNGVKRPEPVFTPEPHFTELARDMRIQGTCVLKVIVGIDGKVHDVQILRPLGAGLDEQAISTVQTWKFKPATRNGQPVPVEMSLEIAFNLLN